MTQYFRTPEMQNGGPFNCLNCGKALAVKIVSPSNIQFKCPRCHAFILIKMGEPVTWATNSTNNKEKSDVKPEPASQSAAGT